MSVDQIKSGLASLSPAEQSEISAYLFHLRRASDPEYQELIRSRMADKDPTHWLTLDEFEQRLGQD